MTECSIMLGGERLLLDPAGAVFWPTGSVLAVADLHLEKGSAAACRGQLVPPWDSGVTLARLAALLAAWRPRVLVAVGDSFHDQGGPARLGCAERAAIGRIAAEVRIVWVSGNHDPAPPDAMPGVAVEEWCEAGLVFRHQARAAAEPGEISGHYHPKARVVTRAGEVVRACFVSDPRRLVLPAFGAYTGGLDVRSPALGAVFPQGGSVHLLGVSRLYHFALAAPAAAAVPA
jgi:DNA ligase-associated metallophosphoesterase